MWMVLSGKCDRASYAMAIWKDCKEKEMRSVYDEGKSPAVSDKGALAVHIQE